MKTRHLNPTLLGALLIAAIPLLLTSCYTDDDWYDDGPGWNNGFYDGRLEGWWELVQADGVNVGRYDTNYMDFLGGGRGYYYYYNNGHPYSERLTYYCQESASPSSRYQINIRYEDGTVSTMSYWFTDSTGIALWLSWYDNSIGRTVTYLYRPVNGAPW